MIYRRGASSPALFLQGGFTLLEMMVVLFIGGLAIALVAPRFNARIEDYERGFQLREVENSVRVLPRRARLTGQVVELPRDADLKDLGDGRPVLEIPEGWDVRFSPSWYISSLGACSEAKVSIAADGGRFVSSYRILEFSCELVPEQ